MADEYINKAELMKEAICKSILCSECAFNDGSKDVRCKLIRYIDELPTIEIVHCRDCKYWQDGVMDLGLDCHTYPDHFCAEGERKDDNNRY